MGCLDDIVGVVNESATPNIAQLVGSQHGNVIVPMYDWTEDTTVKTALKNITQMHHFCFSRSHPGKVKVRNSTTDSCKIIKLLKDPSWRPSNLPEELMPPRLSRESQWYLYEKFVSFVLRSAETWTAQNCSSQQILHW